MKRPSGSTAAERGKEGADFVTCRLCGSRFSVLTAGHLSKRHGLRKDAIAVYVKKFRVVRFRSLRTIRAQRRSLIARYLKTGRRWTRSRARVEIRKLARKAASLSASDAALRDPVVYARASRAFGGWERALKAAGVDPDGVRKHRRWTREAVLGAIRSLRPGELSARAAEDRDSSLVQTARRWFGDWDAALRAAGRDPTQSRLRRAWDPDRVLSEIRRIAWGRSRGDALQNDPDLVGIAVFYFARWSTAVEAARLAGRKGTPGSRKRVVHELRRIVLEGGSLAWKRIFRERPALIRAALGAFGAWRAAVDEAGFRLNRPMTRQEWTRPELMGFLGGLSRRRAEVSEALVRTSTPDGYKAPVLAIRRTFGSLAAALRAVRAGAADASADLPGAVGRRSDGGSPLNRRMS